MEAAVNLKSPSSALLISRYILRLEQRGRCCFCAACPNRKMYLEIRKADEGLFKFESSTVQATFNHFSMWYCAEDSKWKLWPYRMIATCAKCKKNKSLWKSSVSARTVQRAAIPKKMSVGYTAAISLSAKLFLPVKRVQAVELGPNVTSKPHIWNWREKFWTFVMNGSCIPNKYIL